MASGFTRHLNLQRATNLNDTAFFDTLNQIKGSQMHTSLNSVALGGQFT